MGSARRLVSSDQRSDTTSSVTEAGLPSSSDSDTSRDDMTVPSDQLPVLLGSPEFMAPELLLKKPVGVRADYWSIGVLIYVLVR